MHHQLPGRGGPLRFQPFLQAPGDRLLGRLSSQKRQDAALQLRTQALVTAQGHARLPTATYAVDLHGDLGDGDGNRSISHMKIEFSAANFQISHMKTGDQDSASAIEWR